MRYDALIVGAGFAGSTIARKLAQAGRNVLIIDKRSHTGGNAFDTPDKYGVLIHEYGPHIFHTGIERVWSFVSQFSDWRPYEHLVMASIDNKLIPLPFNLNSIDILFPKKQAGEFEEHLIKCHGIGSTVPVLQLRTSQNPLLQQLAEYVYENVFYHYTRKQWGISPEELDPIVTGRVPIRINRDNRYFTDQHQFMPKDGFTALFERMLDHSNIEMCLGADFAEVKSEVEAEHIVYTGPIDEYYEYRFGRLPYRSELFVKEHLPDVRQMQPVAVVNFPNDHNYTRITEFKHLTGQEHSGTTYAREYPQADGEPYYPVPTAASALLYKKYKELADNESNVTFVGRLAEYRYYNMDQAVDAALAKAEMILQA